MKTNTLLSTAALAALMTLSACGGGAEAPAQEEAAPVEAAAEEAPAEEVVEEVVEEEAAPEVADVEATGNVIEIQMYTRDPDDSSALQVFKPTVVTASVGDTIKFVAANPTHQSQSIPEMLPEGVEGWEGKINEEVSYVIPKAGVYGYKCVPHYAAGMVGLIVVDGGGDNVEAAKAAKHVGRATQVFIGLFEEAGL